MFSLLPFGFINGNSRTGTALQDILQNFFSDDIRSEFNFNETLKAATKETPEGYIICAELHGVNKGDIKLSYNNNNLTISVIRRSGSEQTGNNFRLIQRSYDQVARSFHVKNVNVNLMKVMFKDGILIIGLPKKDKYINVDDRVIIK